MPLNQFTNDVGYMTTTGHSSDSLKFKVPSLRNVALTFPYMHDGRFYTLGQVLEHYRTGIQTNQPNLDPLLAKGFSFSNKDKYDLLYFLHTLTDTSFVHNPRFAMK
jgi:cytochrome c peroxidase